ncbi:hypothetical protein AB1Y20_015116 [Prymnesium parvum]|uniref:Protein xylosyltransferase n=1 Tax=Prymnesium parvum TaxID=97485 RepID=A0AB34JZR3_PRYPA
MSAARSLRLSVRWCLALAAASQHLALSSVPDRPLTNSSSMQLGRRLGGANFPDCKNGNIERFHKKGSSFFVPTQLGLAASPSTEAFTGEPHPTRDTSRLAVVMVWTKGAHETMHIPSFYSYWAASAAFNSGIADFFMFHQPSVRNMFDVLLPRCPSNVHYIEIPNLVHLYRTKLNLSSPMTTSIIKDLKPVIGLVFQEYLASYTHWAFSDADVVFGDLSRFLTPHVLAFDIVSVISDHFCSRAYKTLFAGQLTVFRNNEWTRHLFRQVPGWATIFVRPKAVFFDERNMPAFVLRTTPERDDCSHSDQVDAENARMR